MEKADEKKKKNAGRAGDMALLRRARKDMSMAALVEAHRRHVEEDEEEDDSEHELKPRPPMRRQLPRHAALTRQLSDDPEEEEEKEEEEWPTDGHRHSPMVHKSQYYRHHSDTEEYGGRVQQQQDHDEEKQHVPEGVQSQQRRSVRLSETNTVTCVGSDENTTSDSQGHRDDTLQSHRLQQQQLPHGLYHYGPRNPGKPGKREAFYQYEEPLHAGSAHENTGSKRHGGTGRSRQQQQQRPAAKVSSALMKPMQMMRDRSSTQRKARLARGYNSGRGGRAVINTNGDVDFTNTGGSSGDGSGSCEKIDCKGCDHCDERPSQSAIADATGLVKVDEKMIRYIDATLVKPNHEVFNRYTRFFLDRNLEKLYQEYTAINWFSRARWHILLLMLVHLLVLLLFSVLPPSGFRNMDQFILSPSVASTYMQWSYMLIAVPFACLPRRRNPFQKHWRFWVCLVVVLFNFAFQVWLTHAGQLALEQFSGIVDTRLECNAANTVVPVNSSSSVALNATSVHHGSGSGALVGVTVGATTASTNTPKTLTPAQLTAKTQDQRQYVKVATDLYAGALTQILTGFAWLFSFIFVISIRLEFVYVMVVGFSAAITCMFVVLLFDVQIEWMTSFSYGFAVVLLFILSRSSDLTNRRSFLSTFFVERENEALKSSLSKAEAALMNEPAGDEEKQVVDHVLDVPEMKALELFRIPFADLKFLQAIGRGAMGDVIKAKYLGTVVVCKRIRREHITETALESFREEIVLMSCLRHPNIVQFIGASWDNPSNLCIVMEYLENGDMHSVLHSTIGKNFSWADPLLKMAIDVVQGMLYLHSQEPPIVHRDLKSVNVLCSATYGCNVGDFGLSRRYKKGVDALTTLVGTPFWLAPEIIRNDRYGPAADVYSFGIVLTELETRNTPYNELSENGLKVLMRIAHNNLRPTLPPTCLATRRKLITDCLLDEPAKRPSFAEILARLQGPVQLEIEEVASRTTLLERRTLLKKHST